MVLEPLVAAVGMAMPKLLVGSPDTIGTEIAGVIAAGCSTVLPNDARSAAACSKVRSMSSSRALIGM